MSNNIVILKGNLGKDPEINTTQSGVKVAKFSMATKDGFGEKEQTDWHNVVAWRWAADQCQGLKKGDKVVVCGKMKTRSWEDNGQKKYITEVNASEVALVPRTQNTQQQQPQQGYQQPQQGYQQNQPAQQGYAPQPQQGYGHQQNGNNIPF